MQTRGRQTRTRRMAENTRGSVPRSQGQADQLGIIPPPRKQTWHCTDPGPHAVRQSPTPLGLPCEKKAESISKRPENNQDRGAVDSINMRPLARPERGVRPQAKRYRRAPSLRQGEQRCDRQGQSPRSDRDSASAYYLGRDPQ